MSAVSVDLKSVDEQSIQLLQESDNDLWNQYVHDADNSSIYHLSVWRTLIKDLFGHESYYLYSKNSAGEINGLLPLIRLKSRLFGDYMVSMPYFNYGGALASELPIEESLMRKASDIAQQKKISHIEFRDSAARADHWQVRADKITMILDLPAAEEELWQALGSKRRSQIKRPLRENPEVISGGIELLDEFYKVFAINMRDLGTPVYPKMFFQRILQAFPGGANIVLVRLKGVPVGAAFLLGFRKQLEIPWASTLSHVNGLGINMLLYWEVLKFAISRHYQQFDFGRCTEGSGTHKFKKQWGAQAKPLFWHYWLPDQAELPQLTPNNPKYKAAIAAWQKMPVALTNWLGPHIVKNLP